MAVVLRPALAQQADADLLPRVVDALVMLTCTAPARSLALIPLESLSNRDAPYLRRFRLIAREMIRVALARARYQGLLVSHDCRLLARALVNDVDRLARMLVPVEERRARELAAYVFGERLRTYALDDRRVTPQARAPIRIDSARRQRRGPGVASACDNAPE
jgi:hypothetical protein